ncbi:LPS ABC transporter substrate-binding protein LptA [Bradyrhizobium sp. U87765 SZCCT0131]|uniref:LptA/OstA family protein n=1 Tax=unclassified Bradyrhizobium TaxID=2631580 RepID=UPI001BAC1B3D|nr:MULTISPECIES: LptA/OstA family protein [unclassified Bradyrhizobium]MBR1216737.1 LPS ABC transporter substrate-binding protein LptA [Bradyrhizobium sp. U87765 SZCCT0131]MBR1259507.1 LPS ABC transporter substrate-binding protein LptA [Bradyrhizobium sp. U87765 SZCCT0134]MBR1305648.1 LPS ABC transporter substrate-binding protein LptA [Bradyrhizobium sp. U87765 SZCCT0110]MBR1322015.1 LPS ABC transporter substrate-binding protein LptA [Bradyrhizobium sp. U87765 SZCCT0109]MBR1350707.1 LPS ABC tr
MKMPTFSSRLLTRATRCAGGALAVLALVATHDARAQGSTVQQGTPNAMQGFSQNRDKPIQIDAGSLEVRDKDKAATFKDNVKVVQGDTTMRCKTLVVYYEGGAGPGGAGANLGAPKQTPAPAPAAAPGGSSSIKRLEARGGVIVTQKDQTVTGDSGDFDMKTNIITMRGNVVMTQADKVLRGDTLIVDMTTGVSRVEVNSGKKVQVLIPNVGKAGSGGGTSLFPNGNNAGEGARPQSSAPGKPMSLNGLSGSGPR